VLAYGTNEAGDSQWTLESYREMFASLLDRLRRARARASILVLGPPDRLIRIKGRWVPMENLETIVAAQREASRKHACRVLGYPRPHGRQGFHAGLVLCRAGPARLSCTSPRPDTAAWADTLFQDIIQEFQLFLKFRTAPPEQDTHGETSQNP